MWGEKGREGGMRGMQAVRFSVPGKGEDYCLWLWNETICGVDGDGGKAG